ncbi:hypothetical protein N9X35_02870 [Amylibacter sp.]|nr:hypothetical protein [Amylibacter sp.]
MIITRTPLRMSFVGGGSDIESYYRENGGAVLSTTIDRYVYINLHSSFGKNVRIAYSKVEDVDNFSLVEHPLVREVARHFRVDTGLEMTSIADIPAKGTGLGSSSSFTVGLIHAFCAHLGLNLGKVEIAKLACKIEIEACMQPIGKQDQYAAATGGFNIFKFNPDGNVTISRIQLGDYERHKLQSWMMVFYTGGTRSASKILAEQTENASKKNHRNSLDEMVKLVEPFSDALIKANISEAGLMLDTNWRLKRTLASGVSSNEIDEIYEAASINGAVGGKLLGAGAGGFMLFLVPPERHNDVSHALRHLKQVFWNFDILGSSVIMQT